MSITIGSICEASKLTPAFQLQSEISAIYINDCHVNCQVRFKTNHISLEHFSRPVVCKVGSVKPFALMKQILPGELIQTAQIHISFPIDTFFTVNDHVQIAAALNCKQITFGKRINPLGQEAPFVTWQCVLNVAYRILNASRPPLETPLALTEELHSKQAQLSTVNLLEFEQNIHSSSATISMNPLMVNRQSAKTATPDEWELGSETFNFYASSKFI